MESNSDPVVREGSPSSRRTYSEESPTNVYGFPVAVNKYTVLQSAEEQSRSPREVGLVDPRTTRHLRRATLQTGNWEVGRLGDYSFAVYLENPAQEICTGDTSVESVAVGNSSQFFHPSNSLSASPSDILEQSVGPVHSLLNNGVNVDGGETLYENDVKDVACMDFKCNKRISYAGPERSAGRPGHTPTRRNLHAEKTIEDSCAGQEWSTGRPGNRPIGASTAPCLSSQTACLGPTGTASRQPHYTDPNLRVEKTFEASSSMQRYYEPNTSQLRIASSTSRNTVEGHASPAMVALQPRRPPYFCGGLDEDIHTWTSIIDR